MSVQSTSLEAYYLRVLPRLAESQAQVYRVLVDATRSGFDMTDKEICKALHWEINCVTPRRNELAKKGLLVKVGKRRCGVTGNRAFAWKTAELLLKWFGWEESKV